MLFFLVLNLFQIIKIFRNLYQDHHQSFDDIFASDLLLKSEIEFYLKQERRQQYAEKS